MEHYKIREKWSNTPQYNLILDGCLFLILDVLVANLIFHKGWFVILLSPLFILYRKSAQRRRELEQWKLTRNEFLIFLQSVESYVFLGYAVEQAFVEGERELTGVVKRPGKFAKKLIEINKKRTIGEGIEGLFLEYAKEAKVDEILLFAQVLCFLQQKGGDICGLVHGTSEKIRWMVDMENQMEVVYAAKKMEAKIMMIAPIGILLFLNYSNRDYMSWYYDSLLGTLMLCLFLLLYLIAFVLINRILNMNEKG